MISLHPRCWLGGASRASLLLVAATVTGAFLGSCQSPPAPPAEPKATTPTPAADPRAQAGALAKAACELAPRDLAGARAKWAQAHALLDALLARDASNYEATYDLAVYLGDEAETLARHDSAAARAVADRADTYFLRARDLDPTRPGPMNTAGLMWIEIGTATAGPDVREARTLFARARDHFKWVLDHLEKQHGAANNTGLAYAAEGKSLKDVDLTAAQAAWARAAEFYALALEIKPDKANALMNWGNLLSDMAWAYSSHNWSEAVGHWELADEKYETSLRHDPRYGDAAYSWATSVQQRAERTSEREGVASRQHWRRAVALYRRAAELAPDNNKITINLASARSSEGRLLAQTNLAEALPFLDAGIETAELGVKQDPWDPVAWRILGLCLAAKARVLANREPATAERLWGRADQQFQRSFAVRRSAATLEHHVATLCYWAEAKPDDDHVAEAALWRRARELCATWRSLTPDDSHMHAFQGSVLMSEGRRAKRRDSAAGRAILEEADANFSQAKRLGPLSAHHLGDWGIVLHELELVVRSTDASRAQSLRAAAAAKYQEALALDPENKVAENNWLTLAGNAHTVDPAEAVRLFAARIQEGRRRYATRGPEEAPTLQLVRVLNKQATLLGYAHLSRGRQLWWEAKQYLDALDAASPGRPPVLLARAKVLSSEAYASSPSAFDAAEPLWVAADVLFGQVIQREPRNASAHLAWGIMCIDRGDRVWWKKAGNPLPIWEDGDRHLAEAQRLDPGNQQVWQHRAVALLRQYGHAPSAERARLLDEAETLLRKAETASPGSSTYNLADTAALRLRPAECVEWLNLCRAQGVLPDQQRIVTDTYLDRVRSSPEFQAWFAEVFPETK